MSVGLRSALRLALRSVSELALQLALWSVSESELRLPPAGLEFSGALSVG